MSRFELASDAVSEAVIGACFEVAKVLGKGFLEKVDERALELELRARGLRVERQVALTVYLQGGASRELYCGSGG